MTKTKKSKSASQVVLVAPATAQQSAKQQSSSKKKTRKKKNQSQNQVSVRQLLTTQVPKVKLAVSSRYIDNEMILMVSGTEVISEMSAPANQRVTIFDTLLNPGDTALFPRLSAFAAVYDRYRFRKVTINYSPGCPATTTGSIGIAFVTEPNAPIPATLVGYGEYQNSAIGTVSSPLSCSISPREDDWQFVAQNANASLTEYGAFPSYQFNPFFGMIRPLVGIAYPATAGTFYGYLSIDYVVEFCRCKPLAPTYLSTQVLPAANEMGYTNGVGYYPQSGINTNSWGFFDNTSSLIDLASGLFSLYYSGFPSEFPPSSSPYRPNKSSTAYVTPGYWDYSGTYLSTITASSSALSSSSSCSSSSSTPSSYVQLSCPTVFPPGISLNERFVPRKLLPEFEKHYTIFCDDREEKKSAYPAHSSLRTPPVRREGKGPTVPDTYSGSETFHLLYADEASGGTGTLATISLPYTANGTLTLTYSMPFAVTDPVNICLVLDSSTIDAASGIVPSSSTANHNMLTSRVGDFSSIGSGELVP